jgi:hypothetical protein
MSSLWTPGGEIPVDRNRPAEPPSEPAPEASPPPPGAGSESEQQLEEMRRQLLAAPASDVVAQHVMAFYELAAMHLGADTPRLTDAKLAIDAIEAVLDGLTDRLGPAEAAIRQALPQLKMAFVEAKDRAAARPDPA